MTSTRFQVIPFERVRQDPALVDAWRRVLRQRGGLGALRQSPDWLEHVRRSTDADLYVGFWYDSSGEPAGVVPVQQQRFRLRFEFGGRNVAVVPLPTLFLLGASPALPAEDECYQAVFRGLLDDFPEADALGVRGLDRHSYCWSWVEGQRTHMGLRPYVAQPWISRYWCPLADDLEGFLRRFSSKQRNKFRRRIRRFRDAADGDMRLERIDRPDQVDRFFDTVLDITARSWKRHPGAIPPLRGTNTERRQMRAAAEEGVLRSYLLHCRGEAIACVTGYQYEDIFHYAEIAYDERYSKLSPGTVLFLLIVEDLGQCRPAKRFDFGPTDSQFKTEFARDRTEESLVLLLRPGLRNTMCRMAHSGFRRSLSGAKTVVDRLRPEQRQS